MSHIDRILTSDHMTPYQMIPLVGRTITPLHQGTFAEVIRPSRIRSEYKNFAPIHTIEWYAGDQGGWLEIPVISGNSVRGRLRRYAALAVLRAVIQYVPGDHPGSQLAHNLLNPNVVLTNHDQSVLRLLFAGGTMGAKKKKAAQPNRVPSTPTGMPNAPSTTPSSPAVDGEEEIKVWALRKTLDRSEFELLFPLMPIFGYSDGEKKMRPGAIAVTDLVPLFAETVGALSQWDGIGSQLSVTNTLPSWGALTSKHRTSKRDEHVPYTMFARSDPMQARVGSAEDAESSEEDDSDSNGQNSKSQMIVVEEYVPAGQQLYGGLYLHESLTLVETGLLYTALDAFLADGFLGGARTRGYGRVQWDMPNFSNKEAAQAAWQQHAEQKAEAMAQQLVDLFELRTTTSRNKRQSNRRQSNKTS